MEKISLKKTAPKRATNITLSVDVYNEAKALGINLSQTCERSVREAIRTARAWTAEYSDFIAAHNRLVKEEGLPLDQWRSF
ncbi:type II toxin-antitoxin system CcdA family antitoxin [Paralcaligenes sp. KSB-10]|uniref:type II toxin-antitoxin system CcdA family antitoxin n=1 Tax=Paralcaligenes sp. KSB-10 TaxID=2901142 RepID=UPI001E2C2C51|nr:type II toxin-antitoxin system CcdA family antitoxin [Paralcaligenes sp. KSB-10]UHL63222.1 type II toxin-antitoxin system CcdA family antitoxin [Paralcaligenes sp. KSB-10]